MRKTVRYHAKKCFISTQRDLLVVKLIRSYSRPPKNVLLYVSFGATTCEKPSRRAIAGKTPWTGRRAAVPIDGIDVKRFKSLKDTET